MGDKDRIPKHLSRERAQSRTGRKTRARPSSAVREDVGAYQRVLEDLGEVFIRADADGTIVEVSPSPLAYGYTAEDLIGKPALGFYGGSKQRAALLAALAEHGGVADYEVHLRARDGRTVVASANVRQLRRPDGTVVGAEALLRDITGRKRAEEELRKARDELEARVAERTAELSRANESLNLELEERRRTEEALRRQTEKLEGVISSLTDGLDVVGRDYRVHFQNNVLRDRFGDLTGELCFKGYMGRESPCEVCPMEKAIAAGTTQTVLATGADGREYEVRSTPFLDSDGETRVIEIARDVTERKQAEEALRESEARFRTAVETMLDCFGVYSAVRDGSSRITDFRVDYVNAAACANNRLSKEEQIGHGLLELLPAHRETGLFDEYCQVVETGHPLAKESLLYGDSYASQRLERAFDIRAVKLGDGFAAAWRDVTERKRAEDALRESEERLRRLAENARDIIYRYRLLPTRGFDYVSPAAAAISGYTPEEHHADPDLGLKMIHPDDRELLREVLEGGRTDPVVLRWIRKDGTSVWTEQRVVPIYDDAGNRIALEGIARDVTERVKAEEALREERDRAQRYLDVAGVMFVAIGADERVTLVNSKGCQILGCEAAEIVGKNWFDTFLPARTREEVKGIFRQLVAGDIPPAEYFENPVLTKSGEERTIAWHNTVVRDQAGNFRATLSSGEDITERKRAEEALRESEERLRTVVTNAPVILLVVNREGVITLADGLGLRALNRLPEDVVGLSLLDMFPHVPEVADTVKRALSGDSGSTTLVGTAVAFETHYAPVKDRRGMVTGVVGVAVDVTERKRAEEALRRREREVRVIAENVPALFSYVDAQGHYRFVNKRYGEWFGLAPTDIIGKHYRDILGQEAYALIRDRVREVLSGERVSFEEALPYKHGGTRWVIADYVPDSDERGKVRGFFALVTDITERKRAEEALRESEERFRVLSGAALEAIIIHDQGHVLDVNQQFADMVGYEFHEIVGADGFRFMAPESRELVRERMASGNEGPYEMRCLRKDGSTFPFEVVARPITYHGREVRVTIGTDITERKRAEAALRESEERYRRLLESTSDSVYVLDRQWRHLIVNDAAERFVGTPRDKLLGNSLIDVFPGIEQTTFFQTFERVMSMRQPDVVVDEFTFADGRRGWYEVHVDPVPEGILCISRDITERKEAEEELERHRHHLAELVEQRTAEVTALNGELEAFVHSVAHDLRAPLRSIDGFSRALVEDLGERLDPAARDSLDRVCGAAQRMRQIIDDLLILSRVTKAEIRNETVDLSALAKAVAGELLEGEPEREVTFAITDGLTARGDPSLLRMALENLLHNAWKFTRPHERARIEFGRARKDRELAYFVRDDGVGFDMAGQDRLFAPFQRLHSDSDFPGTGIGLPTVQRVVHRHGGRVWAEGSPEGGATFYFTLVRPRRRPGGRPRRSPGRTQVRYRK